MSDSNRPRPETWADPVVEAVNFPARGVYAEFAITSVIGPTAMVALRDDQCTSALTAGSNLRRPGKGS